MVIQPHEASSPVFPQHLPVNITEDSPKVSLFALPSRGWADPSLLSSSHMPRFPGLQPALQSCSALTRKMWMNWSIREPQAESITTNKASPVLDRGELFSSTCYLRSMQPTKQPYLNSLLLQAQLPPHQAQGITHHLDDGFFSLLGQKANIIHQQSSSTGRKGVRSSTAISLLLLAYHSFPKTFPAIPYPNEIKIKCNTCQVDVLLQYT